MEEGSDPEIPLVVVRFQLLPGETIPLSIIHGAFERAIHGCYDNKPFGIGPENFSCSAKMKFNGVARVAIGWEKRGCLEMPKDTDISNNHNHNNKSLEIGLVVSSSLLRIQQKRTNVLVSIPILDTPTCDCCWGKLPRFDCIFSKWLEDAYTSDCVLGYIGGVYLIKSFGKEKMTFVNGRELVAYQPQRIQNGDIVNFEKGFNDAILQKTESSTIELKTDDDPVLEPQPLDIPRKNEGELFQEIVFADDYVLSEILSSLDFYDLRNVRLVCKKWFVESSRWFYAKNVHVLPGINCKRWGILRETGAGYFRATVPNVSVKVIVENLKKWDRLSDKEQQQRDNYIKDIKSFLRNNGRCVKSLRINLELRDFDILESVLPHMPFLREVVLDQCIEYEELENINIPTWMDKLSSKRFVHHLVKTLKLDIYYNYVEMDRKKMDAYIGRIFEMFPSLQELILGGEDTTLRVLEFLIDNRKFLKGIVKFGISTENEYTCAVFLEILKMNFQPLKSLELGSMKVENVEGSDSDDDDDEEDKDVGLLQTFRKAVAIHLVKALDRNAYLSVKNPKNTLPMTELIRKFSSTLEHLGLELQEEFDPDYRNPLHTFIIPGCPELKSLKITAYEKYIDGGKLKKIIKEEKRSGNRFPHESHRWFKFKDDLTGEIMDRVNYQLMFPKLRELEFHDLGENRPHNTKLFDSKMFDPFIPRDGDVKCESLRRLKLPRSWRNGSDGEYQAWLTRLTDIFPNVNSALFRIVRRGEFHLLENPLPEEDGECEDNEGNCSESSDSSDD